MSKFWALFKVQFSQAMSEGAEKVKGKKGKIKSRGGYVALLVFAWTMLMFSVGFYSYGMGSSLKPEGALYIMPGIMMAVACIMALFTTIYKTNGLLFGFEDYDIVMSLPVKTSAIVSDRLLILYFYNLIFMLIVLVPSIAVYAYLAQPGALFWPVAVLLVLLTPMVPVVIAAFLGTLIAVAASRFKRKVGAGVIFTLALLALWMAFVGNSHAIMENFGQIGPVIMDKITRLYPLAFLYATALADGNAFSIALFAGVSVGVWALFCAVLGKFYKPLNAWVTQNRARSDYKLGDLKTASPKKALFDKELKRFTSSAPYLLNTAIGLIFAVAMCALFLIFGRPVLDEILPEVGERADNIFYAAPVLICLFVGMTATTAVSLSLENGSLWIVKTLPVTTMDILNAKIKLNLMLALPASIICSTLIAIALVPMDGSLLSMLRWLPTLYLTPIACSLFVTYFGMKLNLAYPRFDWESEVVVIKRGAPVTILVFAGMGLTVAAMFLTLVLGALPLYCYTALMFILSAIIYKNIKTKGVRIFEALYA